MHVTERRTIRVYDLWSRLYDRTFGMVVQKRQRHAMAQLPLKPGDRVLDLGVGTGMTMSWYPRHVKVVGMDLSAGMLTLAAARHQAMKLDHCLLVQADAAEPPFAEQSFDHVLISHTIGVVSDPMRVLRWAAALVRPEGRVVILNHFKSPRPLVAAVENAINPFCMRIGWRSNLSLERLLRATDLDLEYCVQVHLADLWKIVVLRRPGIAEQVPPRSMGGVFSGEATADLHETSAA